MERKIQSASQLYSKQNHIKSISADSLGSYTQDHMIYLKFVGKLSETMR